MISANSLKDFSEGDDDFYSQRHSILTEFFQSLWFALISNTDLLCYLLVFINMVHSQSLLALPMPLMVFLWGTLTVPRPSKTFWISLIAYTEVIFISFCFVRANIYHFTLLYSKNRLSFWSSALHRCCYGWIKIRRSFLKIIHWQHHESLALKSSQIMQRGILSSSWSYFSIGNYFSSFA